MRRVLAQFADDAANKLIEGLLKGLDRAEQAVKHEQQVGKKILDQWPDAYAKYKPTPDYNFYTSPITTADAKKLLDYVKTPKEPPQKIAERFPASVAAVEDALLDDGE